MAALAAAAAIAAIAAGAGCAADTDCSLNGLCNAGTATCVCDKPWGGPRCGVLQYKVTPLSAKNIYNNSDPRPSKMCRAMFCIESRRAHCPALLCISTTGHPRV